MSLQACVVRKYRGLSEELIHTMGGSLSTKGKLTVQDLDRAFRVIALEALACSSLCYTQPPSRDTAALRLLLGQILGTILSLTLRYVQGGSNMTGTDLHILLLTSPTNYT